jgi:integrase
VNALVPVVPGLPPATLAETFDAAAAYGRAAKSAATRLAYAADWKHFSAWCAEHGLLPMAAAPQTIAGYFAHLAKAGKSMSTIRRRKSAIAYVHDQNGHDDPTNGKQVGRILEGIAREIGVAPYRKAALTVDLLRLALAALGTSGLRELRDHAILLVAFNAALRRSEVAALNVEDLRFEPEGVVVVIRRSKTDQEGAGYEIGIPHHPDEEICPVRALQRWIAAAKIESGALFRTFEWSGTRIRSSRVDGKGVARLVKRAAKAAGITADVSGHSLRAGFVTSAAKAGVSIDRIANVSRHKSPAVLLGYVRRATLFEDAPQATIR